MRQIPLFRVAMAEDAGQKVAAILQSGYVGQGPQVELFESQLREFFGTPYLATTNSGTAALHLALRLLDLPAGSEVLTTPLTCVATNWVILQERLVPRWVDVDPMTGNMDLLALYSSITAKTRAIMVVHWGGYPISLNTIRHSILSGFDVKIPVVEDCAHAFGSTYEGKPVGTHGNYCCFSFQAIKTLTTGDGGLLTTPGRKQLDRARLLRWYGFDRTRSESFRCSQDIVEWGYKYHMNDVAASIGLANYELALANVKKQQANSAYYDRALAGIPGLTLLERATDRESACWLYTLRAQNRDGLGRHLAQQGIATSRVHNRNDQYTCTKSYAAELPGLDRFTSEMLCIPVGWWLTPEDRDYIVAAIRQGW